MNPVHAREHSREDLRDVDDVSVLSWFRATHHVALARRFLGLGIGLAALGIAAALMLRLELLTPAPNLLSSSSFGSLFTMHGILMFYFVALPLFLCVLGNALVPLQMEVRALPFPRLNLAAWYIMAAGGFLVVAATVGGGTDLGWMMDAPQTAEASALRTAATAMGVACAALSTLLVSLNLATTLLRLKGANLAWKDVPLFSWSVMLGSLLSILCLPVLVLACGTILLKSGFGLDLFAPAVGGDPVVYRKLFWLFGAPVIFAIGLPAVGLMVEVLAGPRESLSPRLKHYFAYVAVTSFFLWGQHLVGGTPGAAAWMAAAATGVMAALLALIMIHTVAVVLRRGLPPDPGARHALAALLLAVAGTLTGVAMGLPTTGRFLHNTYFMTAHTHVMSAGVLGLAFLAGLHTAWPVLRGAVPHPALSRAGLWVTLAGLALTYLPMFVMGAAGALRRQSTYPAEFQVGHVLITAGTTVLVAGFLLGFLAVAARPGPRRQLTQEEPAAVLPDVAI